MKKSHTPKGEWSSDITSKRLLRTHSTATTFRTLADLGERLKKGENIDGKYFYVAHNFRNEAIDATHLAEFFQGEGFIIGDDLSLAHLIDIQFLAIEELKKMYPDRNLYKMTNASRFSMYDKVLGTDYYRKTFGKNYRFDNIKMKLCQDVEPFRTLSSKYYLY